MRRYIRSILKIFGINRYRVRHCVCHEDECHYNVYGFFPMIRGFIHNRRTGHFVIAQNSTSYVFHRR